MASIRFNIHSTAMPDGIVRDIRITDTGEVWGEFHRKEPRTFQELNEQFEPNVYHQFITALDKLQPSPDNAVTKGVVIGRIEKGTTVFYMLEPPSAYSVGSVEQETWELILTICNRLTSL